VNLPEKIKVQRRHPIVVRHPREKVHEYQLTVTLASIAGFLVVQSFFFRAALHNDDSWRSSASNS
jgi:hypothetical protein